MPRNYFQDPLETGMDAFDRSYDRTQAMGERATTARAGRQLATGDRRGAAATFAGGGMIGQSRQMTGDQQALDDRKADGEAAEREAEAAEVKHRAEIFTGVAKKLMTVPAGQRMQTLQRAMPLFQMSGVDPSMFASLTEEQLSDEALQAFTGEVAKTLEEYTLAPGARRYRGTEVMAENPVQERPIAVSQGTTLLDPKTRKPIYTAPKTYAPRARSGGGSGGGLPPLPPGAVMEK
jgi:hypothetical protein